MFSLLRDFYLINYYNFYDRTRRGKNLSELKKLKRQDKKAKESDESLGIYRDSLGPVIEECHHMFEKQTETTVLGEIEFAFRCPMRWNQLNFDYIENENENQVKIRSLSSISSGSFPSSISSGSSSSSSKKEKKRKSKTADKGFCNICQKHVYRAYTKEEAKRFTEEGKCMAIEIDEIDEFDYSAMMTEADAMQRKMDDIDLSDMAMGMRAPPPKNSTKCNLQ